MANFRKKQLWKQTIAMHDIRRMDVIKIRRRNKLSTMTAITSSKNQTKMCQDATAQKNIAINAGTIRRME